MRSNRLSSRPSRLHRTAATPLTGFLLAGLLAATACGPPPGQSQSVQPQTTGVQTAKLQTAGTGFDFRTAPELNARVDTVGATPVDLWPHLQTAYEELGVPADVLNPDAYIVGTVRFIVSRRVGDTRMSRILDCGNTIQGPAANQLDISLTVLSQLRPVGNGRAAVLTHVEASGEPKGVGGSPRQCSSKGELEEGIVERIQWHLVRESSGS